MVIDFNGDAFRQRFVDDKMGVDGGSSYNRSELSEKKKLDDEIAAEIRKPSSTQGLVRTNTIEPSGTFLDKVKELLKGVGTPKELTKEQKQSRAELNQKVSSTGISYSDAEQKLKEIKEKYTDEKYLTDTQSNSIEFFNNVVKSKKRELDPSKLPEPAKTEYYEAMEAKKEIENNNVALVKKAGLPAPEPEKWEVESHLMISDAFNEILGDRLTKIPSEKQVAARAKLDEKTSSAGMTYKEAKNILAELREKYKDCTSKFESKQPEGRAVYISPHEAFDPYKIPEPDRTKYFNALASAQEVEDTNSALVAQAGSKKTPSPSRNYAKEEIRDNLLDHVALPNIVKLEDGSFKISEKEPTEAEVAARTKLDEKQSSTGLTYKNVKARLAELKEKHKDCKSEFESWQPKGIQTYMMPREEFDPYKIPEPDRTEYFALIASAQEIERSNKALFAQTGLRNTETPPKAAETNILYAYKM